MPDRPSVPYLVSIPTWLSLRPIDRDRLGEVGVRFTGVAFQGRKSDDLALLVDGACGLQIQSGVLRNQSIQVACCSIAPKHGPGTEARANGNSQHQAVVADGDGRAVRIAGQSSEIGDVALLPEKTMKACVAGGVRSSHNLPVIVQAGSVDSDKPSVSAKISQVDRVAVRHNSMKRREIVLLNRIERSAISAG